MKLTDVETNRICKVLVKDRFKTAKQQGLNLKINLTYKKIYEVR